jgi:hypothetical protein
MVLLRLWNDVKAVALVYPISWASAAGLLFIYRMLYRRKKLKKGD